MCPGKIDFRSKLEFMSCELDIFLPASNQNLSKDGENLFHCFSFTKEIVDFHMGSCDIFHDFLDDAVKVVT